MENISSRVKYLTLIITALFTYAGMGFELRANSVVVFDLPALQQQEVTGMVTDENGLPIPGVAVRIKNSSIGTVTDPDGVYTINAAPDAILIFTYLGFQSMEVPVDSKREINIRLEEDVTALGEVEINAGYYYTTRRESTGNISRVTAEEIEMQPVINPLEALQGRMAGVEIVTSSMFPGGATTIRIRGTNSLRQDGNNPMYIVDGVPVDSSPLESNSIVRGLGIDPLNTLNISNIESIEVLKDADATAIYGSRGANGVILLTTKKAREGKIQLQANIYSGASKVPNRVDLLNTQQYLQVRKKAFENDNIEPTEQNAYDLLVWDQNRYTDWQEYIFGGTSPVTDVNVNLSGGDKYNSFRLASSYHTVGTVFIGNNEYQKVTASFQTDHQSRDNRFHLTTSVNYGVDNNNLFGNVNLTPTAFDLPPNAPKLHNEDGSLHWEEWNEVGLNNPLEGYFNNSINRGHNLNSNLVINYELLTGLNFKTNLGYNQFNRDEVTHRPKRSYNPFNSGSLEHRSTHQISEGNSWIIEPQMIYSNSIKNHNLELLIGGTFQQVRNKDLTLVGQVYITESLIGNLSAAESISSSSNPSTEYRYNAIFGRIGYNWNGKYFINLTGRRDGSSRFGPGKRFANFGALGVAWIFSEEPFMRNHLSFLSFGKFRGSYGTTGNDQIGDYGYLDAYEVTIGPGGLYPNQLANRDYSWEVNKKLELALDLGFFRDRINLGISWFQNRSSNQLVGYPLPYLTGFSVIQANLPATVENKGWEVEFTSYNLQRRQFLWQTSFNFTLPKNRLVEYPNIEESSYANTYRVGHPLNIDLLYQYTGLDSETGFYTVQDVNGDGSYDIEDQHIVWDRGRAYYGGISNNLKYKNFSLQFLFQYVKQEGKVEMFNAGQMRNQRVEVLDALRPDSDFQRISTGVAASQAYSYARYSTLPIVDASFFRLKTLGIQYSLPEPALRTFGLVNGKVFLQGQNLITFTNYKGLDPSNPSSGTSFSGLRTITAGLQFTF